MIRKSSLVSKHTVLFLMYLVVSHPKCLLFKRLAEVFYCRNFMVWIAAIVNV